MSHDREFLDNVVTSILVFEADGSIKEYVGGYQDWANRGIALKESESPDGNGNNSRKSESTASEQKSISKKLSYKLKRELELLPQEIETLESEITSLESLVSEPEFYDKPYEKTRDTTERLAELHTLLERKTQRWVELEEMGSN